MAQKGVDSGGNAKVACTKGLFLLQETKCRSHGKELPRENEKAGKRQKALGSSTNPSEHNAGAGEESAVNADAALQSDGKCCSG